MTKATICVWNIVHQSYIDYFRVTYIRHSAILGAGNEVALDASTDSIESHASVVSMDFDQAASYALERLIKTELKLKPEQVKAIRHVYGVQISEDYNFSNLV